MKVPAPLIILDSFGDSALNFRLLCWVADIDNWLLTKSMLMSEIFEEFYKNGIEIPFPQRDVNLYIKEKDVPGPGNLSRTTKNKNHLKKE